MNPKRLTMTPKEVVRRLEGEGWAVVRKGPGDHVQPKHAERAGRVTVDMGVREIPIGTLRSVFRQAGWDW